MGTVMRVGNPKVLDIPEVEELFKKAFETGAMASGWSVDVKAELAQWIVDPMNGVWLGEEKGKFKSLLIVCLPQSRLMPKPCVYLVYNVGSKSLMRTMIQHGIEFIGKFGYTQFYGLNRTTDDATYMRLFRHVGKIARTGSLMEYDLK